MGMFVRYRQVLVKYCKDRLTLLDAVSRKLDVEWA